MLCDIVLVSLLASYHLSTKVVEFYGPGTFRKKISYHVGDLWGEWHLHLVDNKHWISPCTTRLSLSCVCQLGRIVCHKVEYYSSVASQILSSYLDPRRAFVCG